MNKTNEIPDFGKIAHQIVSQVPVVICFQTIIFDILETVNEEQLAIADKKMDKVIGHVNEKTLPPRRCGDKFCDSALGCPFTSLCFEE